MRECTTPIPQNPSTLIPYELCRCQFLEHMLTVPGRSQPGVARGSTRTRWSQQRTHQRTGFMVTGVLEPQFFGAADERWSQCWSFVFFFGVDIGVPHMSSLRSSLRGPAFTPELRSLHRNGFLFSGVEPTSAEKDTLTRALGLQVPPQKVFGPSKPIPNTFLEGAWSPRVY